MKATKLVIGASLLIATLGMAVPMAAADHGPDWQECEDLNQGSPEAVAICRAGIVEYCLLGDEGTPQTDFDVCLDEHDVPPQ